MFSQDPRDLLWAELNRLRASGCGGASLVVPDLSRDARLDLAAQLHTEEMARRDVLDHVGNGGTSAFDRLRTAGYTYRAAAENIASGNPTPLGTLDQWRYSPGHCLNMMSPLYTQVGLGHAVAASGRHYWTMDLGAPW
jgi:uncharacterized protein YkwD